MRRVLDGLFTGILLFFAVPTILILISWNAIPGDRLYPLKTGLEDVVLTLFSGTPLVPKVSMSFTERRFTEASKLLDEKGSSVGYEFLVAEAQQTQNYLVSKNDTVTSEEFIKNIEAYQEEIQQKKVEVSSQTTLTTTTPTTQKTTSQPVTQTISQPTTQTSTPTTTQTSTTTTQTTNQVLPEPTQTSIQTESQQVVVNVPRVVVIQQETPQEVVQQLERTDEELERIKVEVRERSNHGRGQETRDEREDNGNGNSQNPQNNPGAIIDNENGQTASP